MALSDVTADGIRRAMAEYDRLGRDQFLRNHGFGPARAYHLVSGGRRYDSKAIVGVAHGFDRPDLGPLRADGFVGGVSSIVPLLIRLGFQVEESGGAGPAAATGDGSRTSEGGRRHDNPPDVARSPDLLLVGCVKSKRDGSYAASDLYTSALFAGRRARAEETGAPWFVLSALHGVVAPIEVIGTYDVSLVEASASERRAWSQRVLDQLDERLGSLRGVTIEILAGAAYVDFGLVAGLERRGAEVVMPLRGMRMGEQLQWFARRNASTPSDAVGRPRPGRPGRSPDRTQVRRDEPRSLASRRALVAQLTSEFSEGTWDLRDRVGAPQPGWEAMPEFRAVAKIRRAGATDVQIRSFLTFTAAMDRARDADRLWDSATRLFLEQPSVFDPEAIQRRNLDAVGALLRDYGVSQKHGPDFKAWRRIAEALVGSDSPIAVRRVVAEGVGDASELMSAVRAPDRWGSDWFPLLRGPKIAPLWIRMLSMPGEADIAQIKLLPVAVDTQVRKVTEYLRVTVTHGLPLEQVRHAIEDRWSEVSEEAVGPRPISGTAAGLDPALWFFGKWGCTRCERARRLMPISAVCSGCRLEFVTDAAATVQGRTSHGAAVDNMTEAPEEHHAGTEDGMREFVDAEEDYLAWLEANPEAFVVNALRPPAAGYLVLHRATCGSISTAHGNYTTGSYMKACARRRADLDVWAGRIGGELQPCGMCMP